MISHGKDIKVFCGNANRPLAEEICRLMGTKLGEAEVKGFADDFELLEKVETIGAQLLQEKRRSDDPICANVDMYSGLVYHMLGIPQEVFTPLFATARIAGWCANRIEEVLTGNRIMRPAYRAVTIHNHYVPMQEREAHMELPE